MKLLLRQVRIIDPASGRDEVGDFAIARGQVVDPAAIRGHPDTQHLDATGLVVAPGFIDLHVHLREPGQEYKEDIASGTRAAAAGGFTAIVAMPNTTPPTDRVERVLEVERRAKATALVRVLPSACITTDRAGGALSPIAALRQQTSVVCLTDDGDCVQDREVMHAALVAARAAGLPVVDHCECRRHRGEGALRAGPVADWLKVPGMPAETESLMVERDIELARATGARVHVQHVSCRRSVELVRAAQAAGLPVSAEATPHHLALTVDDVPILGANAKMNPPLGDAADRAAVRAALADGTISCIATDHAPHAPFEKARGLAAAPFGVIGLETAFAVCHSELCVAGGLALATLLARLTVGPAQLLGLDLGSLRPGRPADLVLLDPAARYTVDVTQSASKSRNSPFHGRTLQGQVLGTICRGAWVYRAGRLAR